jgi:hypothetical protein
LQEDEVKSKRKRLLIIIGLVVFLAAVGYLAYTFFVPSIDMSNPQIQFTGCFADGSGDEQAFTRSVESAPEVELPFDLTGTWAQHEIGTTISSVPIVGEVDTTTTSILRVEMRQTGNRVEMVAQDCGLFSETTAEMSEFIVPQAYVDAMEPGERHAVVVPTASGGFSFRQGRFTRVVGAHLTDLEHEALPTEDDDPRVFDDDGDGNPGATVRTEGIVDGDIYVVQRNWVEMCGDVVSPDRIFGHTRWGSDQSVLGASSFILNQSPDSMPHPDPERHLFTACRIDPAWTCQDILQHKDTLFAQCDTR